MKRTTRGWRIGQTLDLARRLVVGPMLLAVAVASLPPRDAQASDQAVAKAGREGRALLRELQDRQTPGASASTPSDPVKREAARMRTDLRRDQKRQGSRPASPDAAGGVRLTKGICSGCGV